MPRGSRKYGLGKIRDILRAAMVISQNKVECGEALDVSNVATSAITLDTPCRRIRVTVVTSAYDTPGVWFSWGTDYTKNAGGRVMVTTYAPLDILLDNPEAEFFVRRVDGGTVSVGITGVY